MASAPRAPPPPPPPPPPLPPVVHFNYKGHDMHPVNTQLRAGSNFLADEDPDRCLNFESRIEELEEFVQYIENERIPHDETLLKHVKSKLLTHREWEKSRAHVPDNSLRCIPAIQLYSTRLVSAETSLIFEKEKEALSVANITREDNEVFSVDREKDHTAFLKAMRRETNHDPVLINEDKSLLWAESRAYGWAVNDPALIPVWMHPIQGIPKKGKRLIEESAWYRKSAPTALTAAQRNRPGRKYVPDYILVRENRINSLFRQTTLSEDDFQELENLLYFHEPKSLRALHDQILAFEKDEQMGRRSLNPSEMSALELEFYEKHTEWMSGFQNDGVYLVVRLPGALTAEVDQPGVFYIDHGILQKEHLRILEKANSLLQRYLYSAPLSHMDRISIHSLLAWSWPTKVHKVIYDAVRGNPTWDESSVGEIAGVEEFKQEKREIQRTSAANVVKFAYLRPGEIPVQNPAVLYLPWHLTTFPETLPLIGLDPEPSRQALALSRLINRGLGSSPNLQCQGGKEKGKIAGMTSLLQQVAYPHLRALLVVYQAMEERFLRKQDAEPFQQLKNKIDRMWSRWVSGFQNESIFLDETKSHVKVKMPRPGQPDEDPEIFYARREIGDTAFEEDKLQNIRSALQSPVLTEKVRFENLPEDEHTEVGDLRSPESPEPATRPDPEGVQESRLHTKEARYAILSEYDCRWLRNLRNAADLEPALMSRLERAQEWWLQTKEGTVPQIRCRDPSIDPDDDPITVYYRGPLESLSDLDEAVSPDLLSYVKSVIDEDFQVINSFENWDTIPGLKAGVHPILQTIIERASGSDQDHYRFIVAWYLRHLRQHKPDVQGPIGELQSRSPYEPIDKFHGGEIAIDSYVESRPSQTIPFRRLGFVNKKDDIYELMKRRPGIWNTLTALQTNMTHLLSEIKDDADCSSRTGLLVQPRSRFYLYLEQFMNDETYEVWEQYLQVSEDSTNQRTPEENSRLMQSLEKEFASSIAPWIQSMMKNGLSIIPPYISQLRDTKQKYPISGREEILFFQHRSAHSKPDVLAIFAPIVEGFGDPKDVEYTIGVADKVHEWQIKEDDPGELILVPTADEANMKFGERRINELLQKRRENIIDPDNNEALTWEENEDLIIRLRPLMEPWLAFLDDELVILDERARSAPGLPPEDEIQYQQRWEDWNIDYKRWLSSFPNQIRISRGNDDDRGVTGLIRLQSLPSNRLDRVPRSIRKLPLHYARKLQEVNAILKKPDLNDQDGMTLHRFISPLLADVNASMKTIFRLRAIEYFGHNEGTKNRDLEERSLHPEDRAFIGLLMDELHHRIVASLRQTPVTEIRIEEPVAGAFQMAYSDDSNLLKPAQQDGSQPELSGSSINLTIKEREEDLDAIMPNVDDERKKARKIFYDLARRIRLEDLDPGSYPYLKQCLSGLEDVERFKLLQEITSLLAKSTPLSDDDLVELTRKESTLLWHKWANENKDLVEVVILQASSMFEDPIKHGVTSRLEGSELIPTLPSNLQPNEAEIMELEIKLNNLIFKHKTNILSPDPEHSLEEKAKRELQRRELYYLIIPFLGTATRYQSRRLEEIENKYLSAVEVLNTSESLVIVEGRRQLQADIEKYLIELPDHGIFIDTNWFSPNIIGEACSRARVWMEKIKETDASLNYPSTKNSLEDKKMAFLHDVYAALRDNNDKDWETEKDIKQQFFGEDVAQELINLRTSIDVPETVDLTELNLDRSFEPDANAQVLVQKISILQLKRQFLSNYMCWLSNKEIAAIREYFDKMLVMVDFTPMVERRGIQRAAIELALNYFATNQEQHRPEDRFRVLDVAGQQYVPRQKELPICLPIESWKRPLEADTFDTTKKMLVYRQWKDFDYSLGRQRAIANTSLLLKPPKNFLGPLALADGDTYKEAAREKQVKLAEVAALMQEAQLNAPRPLMANLLQFFAEGLTRNGRTFPGPNVDTEVNNAFYDEVALTKPGIDLLVELSQPSWDETAKPYDFLRVHGPPFTVTVPHDMEESLKEFSRDLESQTIPLWPSGVVDTDGQAAYDRTAAVTRAGARFQDVMTAINDERENRPIPAGPWDAGQARDFAYFMYHHDRINLRWVGMDPALEDLFIWRVPLNGHPENKYITAPILPDATTYPVGLREKQPSGAVVVRYDKAGTEGPAILQPNKFPVFKRLAWRLGRDLRTMMNENGRAGLTIYNSLLSYAKEQAQALRNALEAAGKVTNDDRAGWVDLRKVDAEAAATPEQITLQSLASNLLDLAPELLRDAVIATNEPTPPPSPVLTPTTPTRPPAPTATPGEGLNIQVLPASPPATPPRINPTLQANDPDPVWEAILADKANMTDYHAGQLLQMQIIEELNNNWESRFPEKENIWTFAVLNLEPVARELNGMKVKSVPLPNRYFDMRQWPLECQSKATQALIKASGPIIQEKPKILEPAKPVPSRAAKEAEALGKPTKWDRHIRGSRPNFPFGETPYQAAYQSFRMEEDLKDVPEFQPRKKERWRLPFTSDSDDEPKFAERFPLPKPPMDYRPTNISLDFKRHQVVNALKRNAGSITREIPELYHSQEEIEGFKRLAQWRKHVQGVEIANKAIEKFTGRPVSELTPQQLNDSRRALQIDLTMGTFDGEEVALAAQDYLDLKKAEKAAAAEAERVQLGRRRGAGLPPPLLITGGPVVGGFVSSARGTPATPRTATPTRDFDQRREEARRRREMRANAAEARMRAADPSGTGPNPPSSIDFAGRKARQIGPVVRVEGRLWGRKRRVEQGGGSGEGRGKRKKREE